MMTSAEREYTAALLTTIRRMLFTLGVSLAQSACGGNRPGVPESTGAADAQAAIALAPAPANACGWIPVSTVAEVLGPLAGPPRVVRSIERPTDDSTGMACRYDLDGSGAVVLQVDLEGGIIGELVGGSMMQQFREALGGTSDGAEAPQTGWDRTGKLMAGFASFTGRVGHIAISAVALSADVDTARTASLARRVRDAIPDLPFALPPDPELAALEQAAGEPIDEPPAGPSPCDLISREEAEAVLGQLLVPPYRSTDAAPLAHPAGTSCAYFTRGHRAFVVRPRWDSGKMLFRMAVGVSGAVSGVLASRDAGAADTLEGAWEESASNPVTGQLYFLRGDRMLEINYLTSSTDMAGAMRLAGIAMRKL